MSRAISKELLPCCAGSATASRRPGVPQIFANLWRGERGELVFHRLRLW